MNKTVSLLTITFCIVLSNIANAEDWGWTCKYSDNDPYNRYATIFTREGEKSIYMITKEGGFYLAGNGSTGNSENFVYSNRGRRAATIMYNDTGVRKFKIDEMDFEICRKLSQTEINTASEQFKKYFSDKKKEKTAREAEKRKGAYACVSNDSTKKEAFVKLLPSEKNIQRVEVYGPGYYILLNPVSEIPGITSMKIQNRVIHASYYTPGFVEQLSLTFSIKNKSISLTHSTGNLIDRYEGKCKKHLK